MTKTNRARQYIAVFQQHGSGEKKIRGIRHFGRGLFRIEIISLDELLPDFLDNTDAYFPENIQADLVLDFLSHPDLSQDLALKCRKQKIPVIASGKKWPEAITPPT